MTTALFTFTFFNSGQNLRPEVVPLNNVFSKAVANLYSFDTSTNVFPSLHVYNAVVVTYSFWTSNLINTLKEPLRSILKGFSLHLCIMIILSTVFLKQHSVVDIYGAFGMFAIMYLLDVRLFHRKSYKSIKEKRIS
jgi:membrane-associated phospholipid phosphatase